MPALCASAVNRWAQSFRCAWLSGREDGPCWRMTTSQSPERISFGAALELQWSLRLQPPETTEPVSSFRPADRASAETAAGQAGLCRRKAVPDEEDAKRLGGCGDQRSRAGERHEGGGQGDHEHDRWGVAKHVFA